MLIFLPPKPFFSTPFHRAAGSGTAPTLVPFYLRRVSTPSASLSEAPLQLHPRTPRSPSFRYRHEPYTRPIPDPASPLPSTKHHGSHGGSYGINKSGAHAPQLPSLLPSAATSQPLDSSSLRPTTPPPLQPSRLSLRTVAFYCITASRFLLQPPCHQHAPGSLYLFLWISFFPSNLRVQIAPTSTPSCPFLSLSLALSLRYSSFRELCLKMYNNRGMGRVSDKIYMSVVIFLRHIYFICIYICVACKTDFWRLPRGGSMVAKNLPLADISALYIATWYRSCLNLTRIHRTPTDLH